MPGCRVQAESGLCSEHNGGQILNNWTTREIQARALEFKSWFQLISWGKLFNFFEPQFPHCKVGIIVIVVIIEAAYHVIKMMPGIEQKC